MRVSDLEGLLEVCVQARCEGAGWITRIAIVKGYLMNGMIELTARKIKSLSRP